MSGPYDGKSTTATVPGVSGENTAGGNGLVGTGDKNGTVGQSSNPGGSGVLGQNTGGGYGVTGDSTTGTAVFGRSISGHGVLGTGVDGMGVKGSSTHGTGVMGTSDTGTAVDGASNAGVGMSGFSKNGTGVYGYSGPTPTIGIRIIGVGAPEARYGVSGYSVLGPAGVFGEGNSGGSGVLGTNLEGTGVMGTSNKGSGVVGRSHAAYGVLGQSQTGSGIVATSTDGQGLTVFSDNDVGIFAQGGAFSGVFNGALVVNKAPSAKDPSINGSIVINDGSLFVNNGDVILAHADCAEDFDIVSAIEVDPGTVMVLDRDGMLMPSFKAYDKRVAGVLSGAGDYKPGIVLDKRPSVNVRKPLALMGKVYCKVDAEYAPIEVGDLLTTSSTPGHAMKASDPAKAFGCVIGKALRPLQGGLGLIPVLVALQ